MIRKNRIAVQIRRNKKYECENKKNKEKQSIMKVSFETVPMFPRKRRKVIVSKVWHMFHDEGMPMIIGYKGKGRGYNAE